ncbi:hypothetical protein A2686_01460 [Candidatus Woesebacteria bacterium RIFCSPHIGHO2_01_FULL_38_10]|nr:MAG: hypothetical protein A2686_01460 [Candidatus Woesebacteria bacterium RIFCSPHIGHO2_01_FULL_38_10]
MKTQAKITPSRKEGCPIEGCIWPDKCKLIETSKIKGEPTGELVEGVGEWVEFTFNIKDWKGCKRFNL